jgi:hypothetical protein
MQEIGCEPMIYRVSGVFLAGRRGPPMACKGQ